LPNSPNSPICRIHAKLAFCESGESSQDGLANVGESGESEQTKLANVDELASPTHFQKGSFWRVLEFAKNGKFPASTRIR
jgi:hypothetical protein